MSENIKRRFKTVIAGKDYTLVGKDSLAHMQAVSDIVNEQFKQIAKVQPDSTQEQRAVLVAFNAVSKQLKMEETANQPKNSSSDNSED